MDGAGGPSFGHRAVRLRHQQGGGGVPVWAGINEDEVVGPVWVEDGLKLNSQNLLPTSLSFDVQIRVTKPDKKTAGTIFYRLFLSCVSECENPPSV